MYHVTAYMCYLWKRQLERCFNSNVSVNLQEKSIILLNLFPNKSCFFPCLQYKSFENTVGQGEIARNEQFLLFPQCFLSFTTTVSHFYHLQSLSIWKNPKICRLEKGSPQVQLGAVLRAK